MTNEQLDAIRARLDAATPGNWQRFGVVVSTDLDLPQPLVVEACSEDRTQAENDVELIAHAPTDLRALLDEVERLHADPLPAAAWVREVEQAAFARGAEAMREVVATHFEERARQQRLAGDYFMVPVHRASATRIRALPVPEDK